VRKVVEHGLLLVDQIVGCKFVIGGERFFKVKFKPKYLEIFLFQKWLGFSEVAQLTIDK
jgi:hypothetical protein